MKFIKLRTIKNSKKLYKNVTLKYSRTLSEYNVLAKKGKHLNQIGLTMHITSSLKYNNNFFLVLRPRTIYIYIYISLIPR
jgi:hypothetical protein